MRWFTGIVAATGVILSLYFGSAYAALSDLVEAAQQGNGKRLLARTDTTSLRRSVTEQIVNAYLDRIRETRKPSHTERLLAYTVGATIADALVAHAVTETGLHRMLAEGKFITDQQGTASLSLPRLADLDLDRIRGLISRLHLITPVEMSVRIGRDGESDAATAIRLHTYGLGWRLSGLELPPEILRNLAARLPVR